MILNKSQAEAVYSAMCVLNNVGAMLCVTRRFNDRTGIAVKQYDDSGQIVVSTFSADDQTVSSETYANQAAFALAYNLT